MSTNTPDLAALLCSRLCHDMMSPVGALANGLELLRDEKDPAMRQSCMELLEQSAKITADKLKFFRLAFGAASGYDHLVPVDEPRAVVDALVGNNGRIEVKWSFGGDLLPKPAVKTLLNLAFIGIESLVRGGLLEIGAELRDGSSEIVVKATGTKVVFNEDVGRALEGTLPPADISHHTAAAAMINQLADSLGGGLQYTYSPEALVMGAVLPQ